MTDIVSPPAGERPQEPAGNSPRIDRLIGITFLAVGLVATIAWIGFLVILPAYAFGFF